MQHVGAGASSCCAAPVQGSAAAVAILPETLTGAHLAHVRTRCAWRSIPTPLAPHPAPGYDLAKRHRCRLHLLSPVWFQLRAAAGAPQLAGAHDVDAAWMEAVRAPCPGGSLNGDGNNSSDGNSGSSGPSSGQVCGPRAPPGGVLLERQPGHRQQAACQGLAFAFPCATLTLSRDRSGAATSPVGTASSPPATHAAVQAHAARVLPRVIFEVGGADLASILARPEAVAALLAQAAQEHRFDGWVGGHGCGSKWAANRAAAPAAARLPL